MREEVESAQLDRDAWKRRGEELEAKLAAIAAGTVEHLDDVPSKAELKTDTTSLGREIVAGLTDFADHLEQGGKADNYKAKPEPSGDAADILLWLRFERAAGYHTSRYGTAIDVIESQAAMIAEQAKEIERLTDEIETYASRQ